MLELLTGIAFDLNIEELAREARLAKGGSDYEEFAALAGLVRSQARPKALYRVSYVEPAGPDTVSVDGVVFTSRVLRRTLDGVHRVFPYVATCGRELDEIPLPSGDFLRTYWLDLLKASILDCSLQFFYDHVHQKYALGQSSKISPGAGDVSVWPIEQQRELFSLFPEVGALIGVELSDSCLMIPNKTVSGFLFPTEVDFQSCRLWRRANCPSRVAKFDPVFAKSLGHEIG